MPAAGEKPRARAFVAVALVAGALLVAGGFLDLRRQWIDALHWVRALGPGAEAGFLAIYVPAAVLFLPSTFLDLGAGTVFGVLRGSVLVSFGSLLAATVSFLIARHLARGWLVRRIGDHPQFRRLDAAAAREGWKFVALARLSPVFPFWLLNYGFGLTRVPLRHYVIATWLGMLPLVVLYVYVGSLIADLAAVGTGTAARSPLEWVLYGVGFVATVALAVLVGRIARRTIEGAAPGNPEEPS